MGWVNGFTPNIGVGGVPVGTSDPFAKALLANGLKPLLAAINPPAV